MARYQYETSPRKLEPRYKNIPNNKNNKKKLEVIKNEPKKKAGISKKEKAKRRSQICSVLVIFALLVMISYRNSLITEEFKSIQDLKSDLTNIEKENKQLEISIEGSLNLNKIEKIASEQLGMQKQTVEQTIYTELPKEDYVEAGSEEEKEEQNWFQKFLYIFK
jgi:cell division protein FtsL